MRLFIILYIFCCFFNVAFGQIPSDKPSEEAWTVFNKTNSELTDNNVIKLLIEPNGMKWIGTERGGLINYDDEKWEIY